MVVIAVAGGAGPVGKALVDGLINHGGHTVFVLSRQDRPAEGNVRYLRANYDDVEALANILDTAKIHTFVSALGTVTGSGHQAQLNMIKAAGLSSETKRFVLSNYDMLHRQDHVELNPIAKHIYEGIEVLKNTALEYTWIANGWFSDYYGMPYRPTHLEPWINVVNMEKQWAIVPGDGSAKANFITTADLGRFFARLMDVEKWSKFHTIVGDELTLNELVELAEKTKGTKFKIVHDDLDKLRSGQISFIEDFPPIGLGEGDEAFFALIHYQAGLGHFSVPKENALNTLFPDIRITKVAEVMEEAWGGRS